MCDFAVEVCLVFQPFQNFIQCQKHSTYPVKGKLGANASRGPLTLTVQLHTLVFNTSESPLREEI